MLIVAVFFLGALFVEELDHPNMYTYVACQSYNCFTSFWILFVVYFFLIGDNSIRTEIPTNEYLQVVIYDHMTRRKS